MITNIAHPEHSLGELKIKMLSAIPLLSALRI